MAPRNSRTAHPAMSQQVEAKLTERKIDYDFEPNVRIEDIRDVEGNQVRRIEHRAPKDRVERYATAMRHGAQFPAILLNDRMERIDGNTRLEAAKKCGLDTIPAYICHGITTLEARSLSVELNQSNGLAMEEEEIRSFIVDAIQGGQQPEVKSLARMTGVKDSKIARWIADTKFQNRVRNAGIDEKLVEALPESSRVALEATHLAPVFENLTVLAAEARMPAAEVKKLVGAVNSAPSQSDALAIVSAERDARAEQLRAVASGFKPRQRRSSGSAQHFGALLKFDIDALLDVEPDRQYETFHRMEIVLSRLNVVVQRAKEEWDLTPPPEPVPEPGVAEMSNSKLQQSASLETV
jgi:ParB-like chromosome segregation protein Spo0J